MANPNPTPRKPGPGVSRQVSVYVPHDVAEVLDTLKEEMTSQERSRTLGRWLMLGMEIERQFEEVMAASGGEESPDMSP